MLAPALQSMQQAGQQVAKQVYHAVREGSRAPRGMSSPFST